MCIKVLVADDAELIRTRIKSLLKDRDDISVIGEAWDFPETIVKVMELVPDVVLVDLHMIDGMEGNLSLPARPTVIAISCANDETTKELAGKIGAARLLDKMDLAEELIPALLQFATSNKPS